MRIIMRIFFLMCILGASLTIAAQNIIYGNKNEQRAINIPQFGIRIVHKKVGSLTNILYLYR